MPAAQMMTPKGRNEVCRLYINSYVQRRFISYSAQAWCLPLLPTTILSLSPPSFRVLHCLLSSVDQCSVSQSWNIDLATKKYNPPYPSVIEAFT